MNNEKQRLKFAIFLVGFAIVNFFLIAGPLIEAFGMNMTETPQYAFIPYDCWGVECKNIPYYVVDTQNNTTYEPLEYSKDGHPMCHDPLYEKGLLGSVCHDEVDESLLFDNETRNFGINPVPHLDTERLGQAIISDEVLDDSDIINEEIVDEPQDPIEEEEEEDIDENSDDHSDDSEKEVDTEE